MFCSCCCCCCCGSSVVNVTVVAAARNVIIDYVVDVATAAVAGHGATFVTDLFPYLASVPLVANALRQR